MIKFTIHGKPIALKRHRPSARGGYYDPSSKDKKQIWLQIAKHKPKQPFVGDLMVKLIIYNIYLLTVKFYIYKLINIVK